MSRINVDATGSMYTKMCRGCRLCCKGAKMVLFVTGACARDCFYCPLSEGRKGKDIVYANERLVKSDSDAIEEARLMSALGTGITGGEPLLRLDRTLHYIKLLKGHFGERHHIHLYTGIAPPDDVLQKLAEAGLDEIRFHPPMEEWDRFRETEFNMALNRSKELGMDAGVEIPAIKPVPEIIAAVSKAKGFLNLNELEFSDTNYMALKERGYTLRDDTSNAAQGSEKIGHEIVLNNIANSRYCSSRFKDAVQLRERIKRVARNTARPFDEISADGTIIYGEIKGNIADALRMIKEMKTPRRLYRLYDDRIDMAWWALEGLCKARGAAGWQGSIVERYPMEGGLVVERIPL
ncbi:radical SAM protein [Methanocella conradii]|uniref:radical SAM protein n=1 Tax=Methanocella conradii TaxID=1175444 RepID=UPI0024B36E30|nr:radical SAM protein [Methanocella conradii]MDI6896118.1 radical SAM protein [Methanocella conradii]